MAQLTETDFIRFLSSWRDSALAVFRTGKKLKDKREELKAVRSSRIGATNRATSVAADRIQKVQKILLLRDEIVDLEAHLFDLEIEEKKWGRKCLVYLVLLYTAKEKKL